MPVWIYEYLFYSLATSNTMFISFVPVLAILFQIVRLVLVCFGHNSSNLKKNQTFSFQHHKMLQVHLVYLIGLKICLLLFW